MAGYYVFASDFRAPIRPFVHPSVRPFICNADVRPSAFFPFHNFSIYKQISFKFCICICTNNVLFGIVIRQFLMIYYTVMALVNVQKMVFGV